MSQDAKGGLVFVVVVASFTRRGFIGSASYKGGPIEIEFDDRDEGVFLTAEMCKRIRVRKGSKVVVVVEANGTPRAAEATVAGISSRPRLSSAKVYYEVGREGGAIVTVRKH